MTLAVNLGGAGYIQLYVKRLVISSPTVWRPMIHFKTAFPDKETAAIHIEGRHDAETLPAFEDVFRECLDQRPNVEIHLDHLTGIDRTAKDCLRKIQSRTTMVGMSEYLRLELS